MATWHAKKKVTHLLYKWWADFTSSTRTALYILKHSWNYMQVPCVHFPFFIWCTFTSLNMNTAVQTACHSQDSCCSLLGDRRHKNTYLAHSCAPEICHTYNLDRGQKRSHLFKFEKRHLHREKPWRRWETSWFKKSMTWHIGHFNACII